MRFGIIKERKNPPDRRVVFSPLKLKELKEKFSEAIIKVEPSAIRIFSDDAYQKNGIEVTENMTDCDVLFGVKEVPIENLIPKKLQDEIILFRVILYYMMVSSEVISLHL